MPPSDKELDKLAKEAADNFEAPGAVPDWEGVSAALNTDLPVEKDRRVRPLLWFILLLLLGGAGYLFTNSNTDKINDLTHKKSKAPKEQGSKQESAKEVTKPTPNQPPAPQVPSSLPGTNNETATNLPHEFLPNTPGKNEVINSGPRGSGSNSGRNVAGKKPGRLKTGITAGTTEENELSANTVKKGAPGNNSNPVLEEPSKDLVQQETEPIKVKDVQDKPGVPLADKSTVAATTGLVASPADTTPANPKKKSLDKTRAAPYEITFAYAPELTTIGFSDLDKPGSSYGILLGYHLSNKFMLQTGFIKSRKNYTADGEDYKLHYPVPPPYKLSEVEGFCDMYELPLNVKYQLTNSKKINTSFTAGISSYFMTRESYVYKYTSSYNSYNRDVNTNSQKNYWLSLATVAVGFEKNISKSVKAGATPYIKIPFKGMGTGELKLISTGINFSLTYRPTFTR